MHNHRKEYVRHLRTKDIDHATECFEKLMLTVTQRSYLIGLVSGLVCGFIISITILG